MFPMPPPGREPNEIPASQRSEDADSPPADEGAVAQVREPESADPDGQRREREPETLEDRVRRLEKIIAASEIHSPHFRARAFAVWGHYMVAHLIIISPIILLAMCAGVFGSR
jgi:hypothetical protein